MPMTIIPKDKGYDVLPAKIGPTSYLEDILDADAPPKTQISSGFYKQVAGEELVFTYGFDEMKVVLEVKGDFTITDEEGKVTKPKRGDVYYFKKGCTITFKAEGEGAFGYFFYCGLKHQND
ncbi:unnamed protein product [Ambrosiozyma monospora]|uniref:Unnamed protein product n=1 Tax=Ambrosiozyma monospora TaxID=43982 RepID=A0ACB5SSS7_AMBMO|nr:unnamed protein product [Ambrosiozyma monospora]